MKTLIKILCLCSFLFTQNIITATEFDDDGNLKSIKYYKKNKDGIELIKKEEYYNSGEKAAEGKYKNGVVIGIWTVWYKNGQIKRIGELTPTPNRSDSLPQTIGNWKYYYENGQIKHQGNWLKSDYSPKRVGIWKSYHDTGEIAYTGNYTGENWSHKDGEHTWYFKNGQTESLTIFKNGEIIGNTIYFNEDGSTANDNYHYTHFVLLKKWYP